MDYDFALKYSTSEGHDCELRFAIMEPSEDEEWFISSGRGLLASLFGTSSMYIDLVAHGGDRTNKADLLTSFGTDAAIHYSPAFAQEYTDGMVMIMQKNGSGKVVGVALYKADAWSCEELVEPLFYTLTFK